jgi:transposase-like protein
MGYSVRVRESVIRKALQGNKAQHEIAREYGIGRSTIGKWLRDYRQKGNIQLNSKENT